MPATVVIMAGQTSAPFSIQVLDDWEVDGTREVVITATCPAGALKHGESMWRTTSPWTSFIGVEEDNGERGRSPGRKGIVSILNPLPFDLVVDLFSDDPSEVAVPAFVIIPAGETMTFFDLSLAESRKADSRKVTITASAPWMVSGSCDDQAQEK